MKRTLLFSFKLFRREEPSLYLPIIMYTKQSTIIEHVKETLEQAYKRENCDRPFTTLTFAQSLDGSIAAQPGTTLKLSNTYSQTMTHQLRAIHDAILVGVSTVSADDPQLTVRLVEGENPRPIIVDSHLRFPLQAKLLQKQCISPIIATTMEACHKKETQLKDAGAQILRLPTQENGRVNLSALLSRLRRMDIQTVMVEGGARIITSFLAARLVDQFVLTISPVFVGGLRAVNPLGDLPIDRMPRLKNMHYQLLSENLIIRGDFV